MNPTKIIPGDQNLPVPTGATAPEAHQRAPTLMVGDGSHGETRVWSPDMRVIRRRTWIGGACFAGMLAATFPVVNSSYDILVKFWYLAMVLFDVLFGKGVEAWKRPGYIATDNTGIGVTTSDASRALLWSEIRSLSIVGSDWAPTWTLTFGSADALPLNMTGHSRRERHLLLRLLTEKAGLQQDTRDKRLYKRTAPVLPAGELEE